ncbi:MAG TPA: hypothetical protein VF132_14445, partial [Rudaea sp.]
RHPLSIDALKTIDPQLSPEQRAAVARHFENLEKKYGVAATKPRVMNAYQSERAHAVFADWICKDGGAVPRDKYVAQIEEEFSDYITVMYGNVVVEPLQTVSGSKVPDGK